MFNDKIKEIIKDSIERFIAQNYGLQELEDPCYNIDEMIDSILEDCKFKDLDDDILKMINIHSGAILSLRENAHPRYCDECGVEMWDGYCIENGMEYYCSEECLHKHYNDEEWEELYYDGNGDSYWTEWYEEEEAYKRNRESEKDDK